MEASEGQINNVFTKFASPSNDPEVSELQLIVYFRCNKACTAISLDACVRHFLIFADDKFLSW